MLSQRICLELRFSLAETVFHFERSTSTSMFQGYLRMSSGPSLQKRWAIKREDEALKERLLRLVQTAERAVDREKSILETIIALCNGSGRQASRRIARRLKKSLFLQAVW